MDGVSIASYGLVQEERYYVPSEVVYLDLSHDSIGVHVEVQRIQVSVEVRE